MRSLSITVLIVSWTVSFLAYLFLVIAEVYEYQNDFFICYSYLFTCLSLLITGIILGKKYGLKIKININKSFSLSAHNKVFWINILCFLSLIGGIFDLINVGGFYGSLQIQRELQVQQAEALRGNLIISYISVCFASLGLIGGCILPSTNQKTNIKVAIVTVYLLGNGLYSLTTGGRIHLLVGILALITSYLVNSFSIKPSLFNKKSLKRNFQKDTIFLFLKRKLPSLILISLISMLFFSVWSYLRVGDGYEYTISNKVTSFYKMGYFINSISWMSELDNQLRSFIGYLLFSIFGALSDGIYNFEPFFRSYDQEPLLGAYQFNFISVRFPGYNWWSWKAYIEDIYSSVGRLEDNVWGTFVRDFVTDFGFMWTPVVCFLSGFFVGFIEKNSLVSKCFYLMYILILMWLAMTIFYSLFLLRTFQVAFLISIVYAIILKFK